MSQVSLLSVSKIRPHTCTPQPCWRALSILDYVCSSHTYVKQVYYYKEIMSNAAAAPDNNIDFALLVSKLKESLSKTLTHYYTLAGRVEHNRESGTLHINCNDAGVPFREAVAECRLADWNDLQECSIEDKLHPEELYLKNYSEAPLIQVQVTKFLCGSIALGYAMADLVADGYSSIQFMKSWSEMHKTGRISKPPLFNAELLKPRNPPRVTVPITAYIASEMQTFQESASAPQHKSKLFTFTTDMIEALVHEVNDGPHCSGFRASSFEAMAALVWKCITEARELAGDETTIYKYSVSLRDNINRWEPCIPINYFGKAVYVACLPARAGDIKAKHVSYAARLMHEDIQEFLSVEAMKSAVDWLHMQQENGLEIGFSCDFFSGKVVNGTSLYTFPIYDTDFGWGRPMHFSLIVPPWYGDGVAFMLPTPQGGRSRYLLVVLPEEQLNKLSTHPLFLSFATPTKICPT